MHRKSDLKQSKYQKVVLTIIETTTISIFHDQATGFLDRSTEQLNNVRMMNSGQSLNFFRECRYLILGMDLFHCNCYILPLSTTNQSKGSLSQHTLWKRFGTTLVQLEQNFDTNRMRFDTIRTGFDTSRSLSATHRLHDEFILMNFRCINTG